jgi:hypothetical protein
MEVTNRGATTTVCVNNRTFKITFSQRWRRLQVREDGRIVYESPSFQQVLDVISMYAQRPKYYTGS